MRRLLLMRPRSIALCLMPALLPPPAYPTIHRHERGYTPGPMVPATYYGCSPPPLRLLRLSISPQPRPCE